MPKLSVRSGGRLHRTLLAAVAVLIASLLAAPAWGSMSAPTFAGGTWSSGDAVDTSQCPSGSHAVGVEERSESGWPVGAVLLCRDGSGAVAPAGSPAGTGTTLSQATCAAGTWLVGLGARVGDIVDWLAIRCGTGAPGTAVTAGGVGDSGGTAVAPVDCTNYVQSISVWHKSSSYYGPAVSAVDLTCVAGVTVAFDPEGGSPAPADEVVPSGTTASAPTAPTRVGYTFTGWYTAATGGSAFDFSTAITADMTLYAQWSPVAETVTFDSAGGSAVPAQTVPYDGTATRPGDPTRTGYTFAGWYTPAGSAYDFSTPVTGDLTLTAHWTATSPVPPPATATLVFDSTGGSPVPDQSVPAGSLATQPADPTRAGYVFDGWYTTPVGGSHWYFASDKVTGDLTLYAQWTGVRLDHSAVQQGATLHITGTGFWPGEKVRAVLHSSPVVVGTRVADDRGTVHFTAVLPSGFATGAHRATLTGLRTGRAASARFTLGATSALPNTGGPAPSTDSRMPELLAAGVAGLGLLLWRRRRGAVG